MVRSPSGLMKTTEVKKGPWTSEEDEILTNHINVHGHPNWRALPRLAGLARCGKSCRLRWTNYLQPGIKRGNFTREEEDIIITSHQLLGNRWSAIAAKLPGRTDNEIKNVWHTHLKKRLIIKEDDIQQSSASTDKSSSISMMMSNDEKDFILVDESIFDTVWDDPNNINHVVDGAPACNTNGNHAACIQSTLPLQRSYSETSYNNYKDNVPSPEDFPETDEGFWSDVLSTGQDHNNNSGTSSSIESYKPFYDQQPDTESLTPIPHNNVTIHMETDHSQEEHASSFPKVGSINQVSNEIGADVDDFWFDALFRAGEHPIFLV